MNNTKIPGLQSPKPIEKDECISLTAQWFAEDVASDAIPFDARDRYDIPLQLILTEECVRAMVHSRRDLFPQKKTSRFPEGVCDVVTPLGRKFLYCLSFDWYRIKQAFPGYRLNAYCELFADSALESGLTKSDFTPWTAAQFSALADKIRSAASEAGITQIVEGQLRAARENSESLLVYIDELFRFHSKLLVIRVDFGFKKFNRALTGVGDVDAAYMRKSYSTFMHHREREFPDMVGYARKLEYAPRTGFHFHFLFFFNGHKVREDITIGHLLCKRWLAITGEHGRARNINGDKKAEYFKKGILGIGMIGYHDWGHRKRLNSVANYLTKADYFVRIVAPIKGMRMFTHGVPPRQKGLRGGRPRSVQRQLNEIIERPFGPFSD